VDVAFGLKPSVAGERGGDEPHVHVIEPGTPQAKVFHFAGHTVVGPGEFPDADDVS